MERRRSKKFQNFLKILIGFWRNMLPGSEAFKFQRKTLLVYYYRQKMRQTTRGKGRPDIHNYPRAEYR